MVAEQIQRMLLSSHAILEFEDLRLQLAAEQDTTEAGKLLDRMEAILRDEIARTELSLLAATRDSRLGFWFECDYVYTPYSLREKLEVLHETLDRQLPARRRAKGQAAAGPKARPREPLHRICLVAPALNGFELAPDHPLRKSPQRELWPGRWETNRPMGIRSLYDRDFRPIL
jgi:hypothetical protein